MKATFVITSFSLFSLVILLLVSSCGKNKREELTQNREAEELAKRKEAEELAKNKEVEEFVASRCITASDAQTIANNYYTTNQNPLTSKSIYFPIDRLEWFLNQIKSSQSSLCNDGTLGVRFYLAKYTNNVVQSQGLPSTYVDKLTVIMRATCNGEDIPHTTNETPCVAFNYGDVCPPLCDVNNPGTVFPASAGNYNSSGNCTGCPQ